MNNSFTGKNLREYIEDYVVFDLETTGLDLRTDEIIEVAGVKVRKGKVVDTFSSLVKPDKEISPKTVEITHITKDMVDGAPRLKDVLSKFLEFIDGEVLVGHNIAMFDIKIIKRECKRLFNKTIKNDFVDTLPYSRKVLNDMRSHRLISISRHFGINTENAHRALADCYMNYECFEKMNSVQNKGKEKREKCPSCKGHLVKKNSIYGAFVGCTNFPECRYIKK